MNGDNRREEIIIIKRGGEGEDGHHGGAWKIAFADFMTAMMALFLVLWLINAANEETKRAVASYFNPVKLVDRNRSSKGLDEQKGGPSGESEQGSGPSKDANQAPAEPVAVAPPAAEMPETPDTNPAAESEADFFANPMQTLDALEEGELKKMAAAGPVGAESGAPPSDVFPDPFGPDFWSKKGQTAGVAGDNGSAAAAGKPAAGDANATGPKPGAKTAEAGRADQAADPKDGLKPAEGETGTRSADAGAAEKPADRKDGAKPDEADKALDPSAVAATEQAAADAKAAEIESTIQQTLAARTPGAADLSGTIDVKVVDDGVMISITDTLGYPMFEIGSAKPTGPIVVAMSSIAEAISGQPGKIRVYGHTDGRQYKAEKDGNWRLSADRARAAYLMLLHGGLDDSRVVQIAGFADRRPRVADNPLADENRRIEILIEKP